MAALVADISMLLKLQSVLMSTKLMPLSLYGRNAFSVQVGTMNWQSQPTPTMWLMILVVSYKLYNSLVIMLQMMDHHEPTASVIDPL